jgi:hypothetical protein
MTEETNMVLEHLKRFQVGQARMEAKLDQVIVRVASLESHVAQLHVDLAGVHLRLDHGDKRVERIERRLELRDSEAI